MATETVVAHRPLNVAVAPDSVAARELTSAALAPGFDADPTLDLRYFGGRTIPHLTFVNVYLGAWERRDCTSLDAAIAAAMDDVGLNNVLAQYFPGQTVTSRFGGSRSVPDPHDVFDERTIEALVTRLDGDGVLAGHNRSNTAMCLLLPRDAILKHGESTSEQGLGGYHGSVHVRRGGRRRETVYYCVTAY
jgi:hypothetical protein